MRAKILIFLLSLIGLSSACNFSSPTLPGPQPGSHNEHPTPNSTPHQTLAAPITQKPAAGICAEFEGKSVIITIYPDMPDPKCSFINPEQVLEIVNERKETLHIKIGHLKAKLLPNQSHTFDLPVGMYLAPGVHLIEVQPCCSAELWLREN
jgi:hypothetical protein